MDNPIFVDASTSTDDICIDTPNLSISPPSSHPSTPLVEVEPAYYDTLVLSGASAKGFLLLGAMQYAHDNYLLNKITNYIGTSAGAMICYLLAIGYTPVEIMVYICTHHLLEKILNFNLVAMINGGGASSFAAIHEQLEKMTIDKIGYLPTLGNLKSRFGKSLTCVTYNLTEDKTEYLNSDTHSDLPCLIALRMSSNLPFVFENFSYNGKLYIDGGIYDNFAIDLGDSIGKKVLGVYITPDTDNKEGTINYNKIGILEYIYRLMFIPISQTQSTKIKAISNKCKVVCVSTDSVHFLNFNLSPQTKMDLFSLGYNQMDSAY